MQEFGGFFLFERTRILVEKKNIRPLWFWVKIIVLELSGNLVEKKEVERKTVFCKPTIG